MEKVSHKRVSSDEEKETSVVVDHNLPRNQHGHFWQEVKLDQERRHGDIVKYLDLAIASNQAESNPNAYRHQRCRSQWASNLKQTNFWVSLQRSMCVAWKYPMETRNLEGVL